MVDLKVARMAGCRRPTLLDGLIFIASMAVSFWMFRATEGQSYGWSGLIASDHSIAAKSSSLSGIGSTFLIPLTPAWLIVRYRRPRTSLRRLGHQPGFLACLSALVALLVQGGYMLAFCIHKGFHAIIWNGPLTFIAPCGYAILGTWIVSAHAGNLRREPGWIDAMGLMIGVGWILMMTVQLTYPFYF